MSLALISIILGMLAAAAGITAIVKPELVRKQIELFPRSVVPAWILTALCCYIGATFAHQMHMGFIDTYKYLINFIAPVVFFASIFYMKELLAARALGGFLLLIAVPILQIARLHDSAWRILIVTVVYLWIIFGIILLMSPWYYRKICAPLLRNDHLLKVGSYVKVALGVGLIMLGLFVF